MDNFNRKVLKSFSSEMQKIASKVGSAKGALGVYGRFAKAHPTGMIVGSQVAGLGIDAAAGFAGGHLASKSKSKKKKVSK